MNEENYTTPPTKLPDQIFETLEVLNQEPDDSKTGMTEFEKMMEYPFSCAICKEAFATPQELENHVLNHRRSTPNAQGAHGAQDPRPGSSLSPQGTEEEIANTDPVIDLQETLEFPEPPTQEATHGLAPEGEVEEEPNTDPNLFLQDTLIIPETPDQEATHESAPGGEVEEEPNLDPNLFLHDTLEIPVPPNQEASLEPAPDGEVEEVPKSDPLAPSEPRTPEKYREPPIQMTTPGSPPGRESEVEPSTPGDSPRYNPQIWCRPDEDTSQMAKTPEEESECITPTAENAEKSTKRRGNKEVLEAEATPEKEPPKDNKPQPVTQSRTSEVQNTDPPITDLELHSN